jgi:hypothetical protein
MEKIAGDASVALILSRKRAERSCPERGLSDPVQKEG